MPSFFFVILRTFFPRFSFFHSSASSASFLFPSLHCGLHFPFFLANWRKIKKERICLMPNPATAGGRWRFFPGERKQRKRNAERTSILLRERSFSLWKEKRKKERKTNPKTSAGGGKGEGEETAEGGTPLPSILSSPEERKKERHDRAAGERTKSGTCESSSVRHQQTEREDVMQQTGKDARIRETKERRRSQRKRNRGSTSPSSGATTVYTRSSNTSPDTGTIREGTGKS